MSKRLQRTIATIVKEVDPERIILFGSVAKGESHENSDIDLLIIVGQQLGPHRTRRSILSRLRRALRSETHPIDLLVYDTAEVNRWKRSKHHVVSTALREGRECYARS